jgi:glycosyltransferase involved in cell wall biosynthesis
MLSIVVIGRNEAVNIIRLARSIDALRNFLDFPIESLYVDSASVDDSVELANAHFDSVLELEESPHLCASAGRFVGTIEAKYPWVFYVDGDMEICSEFFPVLAGLDKVEAEFVGIIGLYIHKFDNGSSAVQTFKRKVGHVAGAIQFGGAVVLRRDAVLQSGNWDPSLYGKEEMELYVRLGNGKPVVYFVGVPMIYHYSEYYSRLQLIVRLLLPSAGLGKVFWGYGQSVRALSVKSNLGAMFRLDYEIHAFWLALFFVLAVAIIWSAKTAGILFIAVMIGFSIWLRPGSIFRYMTLPLSLVPGWFRYFPWFRPRLMKWGSSDKTAV